MNKLILLATLTLSFSTFAADKYTVDSAHASVVFKIGHMGTSNVYGMFGDVKGDFTIDEQNPDKSSMNITIKSGSVDTQNAKRDDHLKKADFFDAKLHPDIVFKSTSFKKVGDKKYQVKGDLTLHGKTNSVTFELTRFNTIQNMEKKQVTGGEAKFNIKRSDYGMKFMVGPDKVGDDVEIIISLEGVKA